MRRRGRGCDADVEVNADAATTTTGAIYQAAEPRDRREEPDADLRQVRRRAARARLRHHARQRAAPRPAVVAAGRGDHRACRSRACCTSSPRSPACARTSPTSSSTSRRCASSCTTASDAHARIEAKRRGRGHAPATSRSARASRSSTPTTTSPRSPRTASSNAELTIKLGRGYVPAERNKDEEAPVGTIPIDALFSPIRKVNYMVTNARVGQRTDYDQLTLEVWTDGSVRPDDAVAFAARSCRTSSPSSSTSRRRRRWRRRGGGSDAEAQREPVPPGRRARALGALGQLPAERRHQVHRRAGAEERGRDAEDQELRPQVAERDQGDPARDGPRFGMHLENFPAREELDRRLAREKESA